MNRELNAKVGNLVMGWKAEFIGLEPMHATGMGFDPRGEHGEMPDWSGNIFAAREVYKRIEEIGGETLGRFIDHAPSYQAKIVEPGQEIPVMGARATAMEICRAALAAVGHSIN